MSNAVSRRDFLCAATGTVSLTWGGMRILASQAPAPAAAIESPMPRTTQPFIYGSAFYRPPNPPASQRRAMLKTLAQEYKFNTIRIFSSWVYHSREPGHFNFEELEEVMGYSDEFGLRVLNGINTEYAPYWLEAAHPETRYVDSKDQPVRLAGSSGNVSGGWPGLCLDWDPVRQAAAQFIQAMAKTVAKHPSMYAYDCWNEPHLEPSGEDHRYTAMTEERLFCYCPRTIAEFRQWLERRYGSLDRLNEAWVRVYSDWNIIEPPRRPGTYADWVDWRRFIIDRSTNEMRFRVDNIRAADSQHVLESHAGWQVVVDPMALSGINTWRLAEVVDTWGVSNFPRWQSMPTMPVYLGASRLEITRCNAGNKPFWTTELQGGHGSNGLMQSPHMRPRDIRLWNWMAVACGAKGVLYWTYHSEATGTEATGFGLVARDGSPTERVLEAAEDNRLIQDHWDIIEHYKPKPEVAILFEQDNSLLTFAMSGNEDASTESFRGYYKALWNCDHFVDFIEAASLPNAAYKVIIAPWHLIGKKETCESLRAYVEGGGTLILETSFGQFDEHFFYNPTVPPYDLAEAFGYREKEGYYLQREVLNVRDRAAGIESRPMEPPPHLAASERIYFDPEIVFSLPKPLRVKGNTYLTPVEITSATPIARYQDLTVGATKKLGKGQVYYIGTNLGASIASGNDAGIELVGAIVAGAVKPVVTADQVRPRLVEGKNRSLLIVFNDTSEDQTASIKLPQRYRQAYDLHLSREVEVEQNAVRLTVPYEGVSVLQLE